MKTWEYIGLRWYLGELGGFSSYASITRIRDSYELRVYDNYVRGNRYKNIFPTLEAAKLAAEILTA